LQRLANAYEPCGSAIANTHFPEAATGRHARPFAVFQAADVAPHGQRAYGLRGYDVRNKGNIVKATA
jgi:hypothetical protein